MNTLTPDVKLVLDRNCIVREAVAANDVAGETVSNWVGKPWAETVSGIDPDDLSSLVLNTGNENVSQIFHLAQKFPSGLVAPFEYLAFRRENGGGFVAVGRDVRVVANLQSRLAAARQSMERDYWKMRELESRYRSLYEAASDPLLLVDADSLIVKEANPAAYALLGMPAQDDDKVISPELLDALASADRKLAATTLGRARDYGSSPRILVRVGPSEEAYMLHARALDEEPGGKLLMVHLMPAGEAPARAAAAPLEAYSVSQIFELSPDAIVVLDGQGTILEANRSFLGLIEESTSAPVIGAPLSRWLGGHGRDLAMLIDSLRLCQSVRQFPTGITGSLGGSLEVEVAAVMKSTPKPGFIVMYIRDVERRPQSSTQANALVQAIDAMSSRLGQATLKEIVAAAVGWVERYYIEAALEAVEGNRTAAARILGISRQGLYDKLARYEIDERTEIQ